MNFEIFLQLIL